jgi:hypothetical protein
MTLDPTRLWSEWNEIFDPLPPELTFIGVTFEPPWVAGGAPAGNYWNWHVVATDTMTAHKEMRLMRTHVDSQLNKIFDHVGWSEDTPSHFLCTHADDNALYPSKAFPWWPSRVENELLDKIKTLIDSGLLDASIAAAVKRVDN